MDIVSTISFKEAFTYELILILFILITNGICLEFDFLHFASYKIGNNCRHLLLNSFQYFQYKAGHNKDSIRQCIKARICLKHFKVLLFARFYFKSE